MIKTIIINILMGLLLLSLGISQESTEKSLLELFESNHIKERLVAIAAIKKMNEDATPFLVEIWQSDNLKAKEGAIKLLGEIGIKNDTTTKILSEAFQHQNKNIRLAAIWALYNNQRDSDTAKSIFQQAIHDDNENIRTVAVLALSQSPKGFTLEQCLQLVDDESPTISFYIQKSSLLQNEEILLDLAQIIRKNNTLMLPALKIIAQFGDKASIIAPDIVNLLENSSLGMRYYITDIIQKIGAPAVPYLVKALHHKDRNVSRAAIKIIIRLKTQSLAALPNILDILNGDDLDMKILAAEALYEWGIDAELPLLHHIEKEGNYWNIWASSLLGFSTERFLEEYRRIATAKIPYHEWAAIHALAKMKKTTPEIIAELEKILPETSTDIQQEITKILKQTRKEKSFDIAKINQNIATLLEQLNNKKSNLELNLMYDETNTKLSENKIAINIAVKIKQVNWSQTPLFLKLNITCAAHEEDSFITSIDLDSDFSLIALLQYAKQKGFHTEKVDHLEDLYTFISQNIDPGAVKKNVNQENKVESIEISAFLIEQMRILPPELFYILGESAFLKITEKGISFQGDIGVPQHFSEIKAINYEVMLLLQIGMLVIPEDLQVAFNQLLQWAEYLKHW